MRNIVYNSVTRVTTWRKYNLERFGTLWKNSLRRNVRTAKRITAKCPYGEVSSRRTVLTAKCPYGEVSARQSVRTAKFPTAKCPTTKCRMVKSPVTATSDLYAARPNPACPRFAPLQNLLKWLILATMFPELAARNQK